MYAVRVHCTVPALVIPEAGGEKEGRLLPVPTRLALTGCHLSSANSKCLPQRLTMKMG